MLKQPPSVEQSIDDNRPEPAVVLENLIAEMQDMPALCRQLERPEPRPVIYLEDLRILHSTVRTLRMKYAVETGSYTGMSAQAMAVAGARVWSIDDYSYEFTQARGGGCGIQNRELHRSILWLIGRGLEVLPAVARVLHGAPWMFLHDSDHSYNNALAELNLAKDLGAAVVCCHDIRDWPEDGTDRAFADFVAAAGWPHFTRCNLGVSWSPTRLSWV